MSHPDIRRPSRPAALAGAVGALLLVTVPAAATLEGLDDTTEQVCDSGNTVDAILAPVCDAATEVVGTAEEALAPVAEAAAPISEVLAPVAEELPAPVSDALPADEEAPAEGGSTAPAPSAGSSTSPQPAHDGGEVSAAGKEPVEVAEPQGPAAEGRVMGPTIQPTVPGSNIAGISSQSGLTLQPYEAMPLVSIPTVLDSPQIAGVPVTSASPVAAVAAGALNFAGDVVLPQTNGQAFLLTAFGLGLVTATGTTLRRRFATTTTLNPDRA